MNNHELITIRDSLKTIHEVLVNIQEDLSDLWESIDVMVSDVNLVHKRLTTLEAKIRTSKHFDLTKEDVERYRDEFEKAGMVIDEWKKREAK